MEPVVAGSVRSGAVSTSVRTPNRRGTGSTIMGNQGLFPGAAAAGASVTATGRPSMAAVAPEPPDSSPFPPYYNSPPGNTSLNGYQPRTPPGMPAPSGATAAPLPPPSQFGATPPPAATRPAQSVGGWTDAAGGVGATGMDLNEVPEPQALGKHSPVWWLLVSIAILCVFLAAVCDMFHVILPLHYGKHVVVHVGWIFHHCPSVTVFFKH